MKRLESFKENGYHVEKSIIPDSVHKELFYTFYDLANSQIKRNKQIQPDFEIKKIEDLTYPNDIKLLDTLLLKILKTDHKLIGEIYDSIAYCPPFLRLVGDINIEEISRELLEIKNYNTIYPTVPRILMQAPRDERRTYGWHQEIFYNIPNTRFIQCYAPIIRDGTIANGTLEILSKSHKNGLLNQTWNEPENRTAQVLINEDVVETYEKIQLPMKMGDLLFFDQHLVHRSGRNSTTDEIRFTLVIMWNDCSHSGWTVPKPIFEYRTISSKEDYNKFMSNKGSRS